MKKLFIICSLILAAAFFTSCEKESIFLPENVSDQSNAKENLSAREYPSIPAGDLFALAPWSVYDNIAVFNYNPTTDEIVINEVFWSTEISGYGFDFNKVDGLIYLLAGESASEFRYLYIWNKETNELTLIEQIISVGGNSYPQDLTFGNDGTLYFAFKNGEINSYNVTTNIMSAFSTIPGDTFDAAGLTYNFNTNQLIYAQSYEPVQLFSIDIPSGNVIALFDFYTEPGNAQAIEYIGNDKLIGSGTFGYNTIFTLDLVTEDFTVLLSPTGFNESIKDLMFINPDSDSDEDGIIDDEDNCPLTANPTQEDTDADGVGDVCDECVGFDDTLDADRDGVADGCDICAGSDDSLDSDGDGTPDGCDLCPLIAYEDQTDTDADGVGDECDICAGFDDTLDTDGDGVPDGCDVCEGFDDSIDSDGDGIPNGCDNCQLTANADQADSDADGVGDVCDNCPEISNVIQTDTDSDGIGDACDDDDDNDSVLDVYDNCPNMPNTNQANNDGDSQGDVCDTDDDNDGCLDTSDLFDFSNKETTVIIDGCNTGVTNKVTSTCGVMMSDKIDELEAGNYTKKDSFAKAVSSLTSVWLGEGLINRAEYNLIMKCARKASY